MSTPAPARCSTARSAAPAAALGTVSARPDFLILMYPVITIEPAYAHMDSRNARLGPNPVPEQVRLMSLEKQVTANPMGWACGPGWERRRNGRAEEWLRERGLLDLAR